MTHPRPSVIVTLPARTVADARKQVAEARVAGADLAELRVDRLAPGESRRLSALFPSPLPLVATLRSRAEGGEGPDEPAERARLLRELAEQPFRWLDIERDRDLPDAEALGRPGVRGLIVSTHLASEAPNSEWSHRMREGVPPDAIVKVVGPASVGRLLHEILPSIPSPEEGVIVVHSTGASGPLLRAWSKRLGFPFVFAALPVTSQGPSADAVEPSQIPVDRLKPFLDSEGTPTIYAVVGHPVAHSRSPALFSRWMAEDGRAGLYVALDIASDDEFAASLPALAAGGFRGLSVTHPFKGMAAELADDVGPGVTACGVANTLTLGPDGVSAENTDLVAVLRRLGELRSSAMWDGASLGVIGAGGAARATLAAARSLGIEAYVWARREVAAETLARTFGAHAANSPESVRPTLVVHATTAGRAETPGDETPRLDWIRAGVHVVDWVYAPSDPAIRRAAERATTTYEDGTRLLAYQAAAAYGLWWGAEPSPERVASAIGGFE